VPPQLTWFAKGCTESLETGTFYNGNFSLLSSC